MSDISLNIKEIKDNIEASLKKSNRPSDACKLICVSKTKPIEMLKEAYACGEREFGENKVQEILTKAPEMPEDTIWHMIGHLQTNKVKSAVKYATLIHSVDSLKLAEVISKEAAKIDKIQDILIEVNIADEDSKFGITLDNAVEMTTMISELPNIRVRGYMCVAPISESGEANRVYFKKLKALADNVRSLNIENVNPDILSMGMSGDYQVAIEEGATYVRVGSSIFGARNYNL